MEQGTLLEGLVPPNRTAVPDNASTWLPAKRTFTGFRRNTAQWHPIAEDDHSRPQGHEGIQEEATVTHHDMDAEERDILDSFERGELRPAPDADREMEEAREAAHNTFKKTRTDQSACHGTRLHARSRESAGRRHILPDAAVERHPQVRVRTVGREQWMNRVTGRDRPWQTGNKLVGRSPETRQDALRSQPKSMETFCLGIDIPVNA